MVFDTLRRYLEYRGYNVKFVQNFTDVDDKIIKRAHEENLTAGQIGEKYIAEYFKDAGAINVKKASVHPRVTENMDDIIRFISKLIEKGYAYQINGDVYYNTKRFKDYGKLSKQNMEELEAGARIDVDERKQNPMDFALWKEQKKEDEIAWDSPWGKGRPGWHIECSVMASKYLGETIDIHAGGQDLTFPHHENEIAQSEALTGKPFANYWMHNGYITINNEKMSKSKGNFFTVRDILKEYDGEVVRFFLLSGHYRSPINFSRELMDQAKNGLARLKNAQINMTYLIEKAKGNLSSEEKEQFKEIEKYREKFILAMEDDLNTADGISVVFELVKDINTLSTPNSSKEFVEKCLGLFKELTDVLGILRREENLEIDDEIEKLVEERQKARKEKNFRRADEIRDELKSRGIILEDTPQGIRIIKEK